MPPLIPLGQGAPLGLPQDQAEEAVSALSLWGPRFESWLSYSLATSLNLLPFLRNKDVFNYSFIALAANSGHTSQEADTRLAGAPKLVESGWEASTSRNCDTKKCASTNGGGCCEEARVARPVQRPAEPCARARWPVPGCRVLPLRGPASPPHTEARWLRLKGF